MRKEKELEKEIERLVDLIMDRIGDDIRITQKEFNNLVKFVRRILLKAQLKGIKEAKAKILKKEIMFLKSLFPYTRLISDKELNDKIMNRIKENQKQIKELG